MPALERSSFGAPFTSSESIGDNMTPTLTPGASFHQPIKFPIVLTCACGDEWEINPPRKFKTQEFVDYVQADWKRKHGEHLNVVTK
jgi:hypothetical protein